MTELFVSQAARNAVQSFHRAMAAKLMAAGNFVPPHLRGVPGDCLAVVMQAARWGMDPFAVGNKTYFVNNRMGYEAQLVNAVVNSSNVLNGRLKIEWSGEGNNLECTVTGYIKGDPDPKTRRVKLNTITTRNSPLWKQDPEQQLAYFAQRAWARLHAPEVLLGVYTPEELAEIEPRNPSLSSEGRPAPISSAMLAAQAGVTVEAAEPVEQAQDAEVEDIAAEPDQDAIAEQTLADIDGPLDDEAELEAETDPFSPDAPWAGKVAEIKAAMDKAANVIDLNAVPAKFATDIQALPEVVRESLTRQKTALMQALKARAGQ